MSGTARLMASLIYGGGLRVTECCKLRIKDLDFDQGWSWSAARRGTKTGPRCSPRWADCGARARVGGAAPGRPPGGARRCLDAGCPGPQVPNAGRELGWFWVFPSRSLFTDPRAGVVRRHHMSDSVIRQIQEYLEHASVETTISTRTWSRTPHAGAKPARHPLRAHEPVTRSWRRARYRGRRTARRRASAGRDDPAQRCRGHDQPPAATVSCRRWP